MANQTLVFVATYNELENIRELCSEVLSLSADISLLVVDDNSPDGTGQVLDDLAGQDGRLTVIHRPKKLGLGSAHKLAMSFAVRHKFKNLVTMDGDFSHRPADIPRLLDALSGADMVIGSRYMKGGRCDYVGYRRALSLAANRLGRLVLGLPVHELTTSFRAFRVDILPKADFALIRSQGYTFFMEEIWQVARAGFRCVEVPIHFADRKHGVSKIPRLEVFRGMGMLLVLGARRLRGWRKWRQASTDANGSCPFCRAQYRVEVYPRRRAGGPAGVEAYRCTSMEHGSKPAVVRCLVCGLLAAEPAQDNEVLREKYRDVADPTYLENRAARLLTFSRVLETIHGSVGARGKLLEVGCYCGIFLDAASKAGWHVEGVEPSLWAAAIARSSGHNVHEGTLDEVYDCLEEPFDVVAMWDVFEHLERPGDAVAKARGALLDDGYLFLSTLDSRSTWARALGRHWQWIMDMHLTYPSVDDVEMIVGAYGFKPAFVKAYWHYAPVAYVAEKIGRILPRFLGAPFLMASRFLPSNVAIPIYLGDVKLFAFQKTDLPTKYDRVLAQFRSRATISTKD